ncbi:hypothetical protein HanIR_Chr14g0698721 [Helianthus annuus]|nr:hypothetical protein HanIR_Chr14g0698721 [Helianthus annuus]
MLVLYSYMLTHTLWIVSFDSILFFFICKVQLRFLYFCFLLLLTKFFGLDFLYSVFNFSFNRVTHVLNLFRCFFVLLQNLIVFCPNFCAVFCNLTCLLLFLFFIF